MLKIGKKYKVKNLNKGGSVQTRPAIYVGETKYLYIFNMICRYGTFIETFRKTEVNPSESFEIVGVELPKIKNQIKIEKDKRLFDRKDHKTYYYNTNLTRDVRKNMMYAFKTGKTNEYVAKHLKLPLEVVSTYREKRGI